MLRKLAYLMAAVSAAAAILSCSMRQDPLREERSVTVTFDVSADDAMLTKAVGEAVDHDKELYVYVYKDGKYLNDVVVDIDHFGKTLKASASMKLVKEQKYDIVFWAQTSGIDCYGIDPETGVMTVDYSKVLSNDDSFDAFYVTLKDFQATDSQSGVDVILKRPFAQVNVGTGKAEFENAGYAGVNVDKTGISISNVADELNLLTGKASGSVAVAFAPADLLDENLVIYKGTEMETQYEYLSMNYILVGDVDTPGEKVILDDFTISFYEASSKVNTLTIPNVPVRRNWRTNIVGDNLFVGSASFDVIIDPDFYGEYDYNGRDLDKVLYVDSETGEYLIENPSQITFLAEVVNGGFDDFAGKTLTLDRNLDMEGWIHYPIGSFTHPFKGTFDGNGNVITGLYVNIIGNSGLFGVLDGTVQNLTLSGASVAGSGYVGGIVGYLRGKIDKSAVNDSKISNAGDVMTSATGSVVGFAASSSVYTDLSSDNTEYDIVGYKE